VRAASTIAIPQGDTAKAKIFIVPVNDAINGFYKRRNILFGNFVVAIVVGTE